MQSGYIQDTGGPGFIAPLQALTKGHELCALVHVYKYRAVVQTLDYASHESTAPLLVFTFYCTADQKSVAAAVRLTVPLLVDFLVVCCQSLYVKTTIDRRNGTRFHSLQFAEAT